MRENAEPSIIQKTSRSRPIALLRTLVAADVEQLRFGPCIRKADILQLRSSGFREIERPIFFLSTGRCGTKYFTVLLACDRKLVVLHAPDPRLTAQAPLAYHVLATPQGESPLARECLRELFSVARERHLLLSHQADKRLVETNNSVTFFAPVIAELLPNAQFVHLHRHPGEVVRSGVRRGWYTGQSVWDLGRPCPNPSSPEHAMWDEFSNIEKISWLWRETNAFIEEFKKSQSSDRAFTLSLNQLNLARAKELVDFVGARVSTRRLRRLIDSKHPPNAQQGGDFPRYAEWTSVQKEELRRACGELAKKYDYSL